MAPIKRSLSYFIGTHKEITQLFSLAWINGRYSVDLYKFQFVVTVVRFEQFPDSDVLWKEVTTFTDALEGEVADQHSKFLAGK